MLRKYSIIPLAAFNITQLGCSALALDLLQVCLPFLLQISFKFSQLLTRRLLGMPKPDAALIIFAIIILYAFRTSLEERPSAHPDLMTDSGLELSVISRPGKSLSQFRCFGNWRLLSPFILDKYALLSLNPSLDVTHTFHLIIPNSMLSIFWQSNKNPSFASTV